MKLLLFSDTHGSNDWMPLVVDAVSGISHVIHLGDNYRDAIWLKKKTGADVIAVKGNCDGDFSKNGHRMMETEGGKIFIAHGHAHDVKSRYDKLLYAAEEAGCKAVFFGHTHRAMVREEGGILMVNPGSLGRPPLDAEPSYAVVEVSEKGFDASIIYLSRTRADALIASWERRKHED